MRRGPSRASIAIRIGCAANPMLFLSASPSRSSRAVSRTPKTVRIITSSVIACMVGHAGSGSPAGQRAISRSATSAIVSS